MAELPERAGGASDDERFALGDLLNRVLDRGVVIAGTVTISIADIDLVQLNLHVLIYAVESAARRLRGERDQSSGSGAVTGASGATERAGAGGGDVPVLPPGAPR